MDLVVFLENRIRATERPAEIIAQQGEELPVTRREFHMAISMLKDMNDILVQEKLEEARRTRDVVRRDLSDALLKVRLRSPESDDTVQNEEKKRRSKDKSAQKDKKRDDDA
eukprot:4222040-Heterocapsa_arctica.AAC.1